MKALLSLLFFFASLAPAQDVCTSATWFFPPFGSPNFLPSQISTGRGSFCELNGFGADRKIPDFEVASQSWASKNSQMECFRPGIVKVGSNKFICAFWVNLRDYANQIQADFILNTDKAWKRPLCRSDFFQLKKSKSGDVDVYAGGGCVRDVSLEEIFPDLHRHLSELQAEGQRLMSELERLRHETPSAEDLQRQLADLLRVDLDLLRPEQILAVSQELREISETVRHIKQDIASLRESLRRELADTKARLESIQEESGKELKEAGIDLADEKARPLRASDLGLTALDLPTLEFSPESFNERENIYTTLARQALAKLERARSSGDRTEFTLQMEHWSLTMKTLGESLQQRSGTVLTKELRAFNTASAQVLKFIDEQVDSYGFFREVGIPEDVKKTIHEDVGGTSRAQARRLRDALNQWPAGGRTEPQKLVLESVRTLGAGFRASRSLSGDLARVHRRLNELADRTTEAALSAARVAIAFTPLNDFVDLCEMATGREGCLPTGRDLSLTERAVSGLGLLIGTAAFWRHMTSTVTEAGVKQVTGRIAHIAESAEKTAPRLGKKWVRELPDLVGDYKAAFRGQIFQGVAEPGQILFQAQNFDQVKPGRWFGVVKPISKAHADELWNIGRHDKQADRIVVYRVKEAVSGYAGDVSGGTGFQFYIPKEFDFDEILEEVKL